MKIRTIRKNHPTTLKCLQSEKLTANFLLKSQGQNWLEYHSENKLQDTISLPSELRMSKLDLCVDASLTKTGQNQCIFTHWNDWIGIGCGNLGDMELPVLKLDIHNCVFTTNCVTFAPSQYCHLSLQFDGSSQVKLFEINSSLQFKHRSLQLSNSISPSTNLQMNRQNSLLYISSNPIINEFNSLSQHLIEYDIEYNQVKSCLQLPSLQVDSQSKIVSMGTRVESYGQKADLVCLYDRDWLAVVDLRMPGLVCIESLYDCEGVFWGPGAGYKLGLLQSNSIYQYEINKSARNRKPILTHNNPITNAKVINKSTIFVQDLCSSDFYLFSIN